MKTSAKSGEQTLLPLGSSAGGSPAKTLRARARERASKAIQVASGTSIGESSKSFDPPSPLWKTLRAARHDGCAKCGANSKHLDIERAPWGLPPRTSARLIADPEFSLLPTPTASTYGSTNNGDPHDGRGAYRTKGKPSLATMAKRGLWPTPLASEGNGGGVRTWRRPKKTGRRLRDMVAGRLNPMWVAWLMGFPPNWLKVSGQMSLGFSETRPSRSARKSRAK
jgi:hypothetical protein